ncbi:Alpha-factor-transporting ATPase [Candida viswanathii]|uniref:Alpha-factor-transporting ATPase n=1 Tax=Candida viswanathii TaxID=5486 RepID=A0A367XUZ7_9ASCO|nr:Alpha-factor-transporting ATPase [Candida viswanathii]
MKEDIEEKEPFPETDADDLEVDTTKNVFMFVKLSKDWPVLLVGGALMSASAAATPMNTYLYGKIMGKLSEFYVDDTPYNSFISEIGKLCGVLIAVGGAKMIVVWMGVFTWLKFGEIQQKRARVQVYNKILKEPTSWYDLNTNLMGDMTQVNRCIEELRSGSAEIMANIVQTFALAIALVVMCFYQSWSITLIVLAGAPIMAVIGWYFGRLTYRAQEQENDYTSRASKILDWCLVNPTMVRIFNGKYVELAKFNDIVNASAKSYYRVANAISANTGALKFMTLMMFVQGFWFGNYLLQRGSISIDQLFTTFSSALMLGQTISGITEYLAVLNAAHAAAGKIAKYLQMDEQVKEAKIYPAYSVGKIQLKNVTFKYPSRDEIILKGVSFEVQENRFNYIIGKSGAGKSTIPLVLMNLYSTLSGSVEYDGAPIQHLDPKYLAQNITLLQQNPVMFNNKTILENIAVGAVDDYDSLDDIPRALIEEAAKFALLQDLDLDTKVTGLSLSGGQQQRVSIARAYLKNSPVLIMDESFGALDNQNKQILFQRIKNWRQGRTTIFITHAYDNIEGDDFVVIMEHGQVTNQGKFANFMNNEVIQNYKAQKYEDVKEPEIVVKETKLEYDYKTNPYILKDLEAQEEEEQIMGVLSILKYCSSSINTKWLLMLGVIIALLEGAASPVFSFCFSKLLSISMEASIGTNVTRDILVWSCIALAIAAFIGITAYLSEFILHFCSENWIVSLRQLSFNKINNQDMSFFNSKMEPAEITTLLMNDTRDLRSLVSLYISLASTLVTMVLIGIIWSIVSGWKLALVGIAFVPLVLVVTLAYGMILESAENKYKSRVVDVETHLHQTITSIKTIRLFHMQNYFVETYQASLSNLKSVGTYRAFQTGIGFAISDLCSAIAQGIILFYGMQLAGKMQYSYLQLLQVITLLTFTLANASLLINQLPEIARGQRAGTFVVKLLESTPISKVETEGKLIPRSNDTAIAFDNVSFAYPNKPHEPKLKNISFEVNHNETVGLVGESGSGKSTIVSILLRLYGAKSVRIYDEDISEVDIDWLREAISIVPQFPKFFDGSIYDNLHYGMNPVKIVSQHEVINVLKLVGMYDFIASLPEGIQTCIGEGTNSLVSGGQLQRLSIARALLRKPKVLIFDECTSNLDPVSTRQFIELIESFNGKYTILFITHDKEMMRIADNLIVLKDGKIAEQGSFLQLMSDQGELTKITKSSV